MRHILYFALAATILLPAMAFAEDGDKRPAAKRMEHARDMHEKRKEHWQEKREKGLEHRENVHEKRKDHREKVRDRKKSKAPAKRGAYKRK